MSILRRLIEAIVAEYPCGGKFAELCASCAETDCSKARLLRPLMVEHPSIKALVERLSEEGRQRKREYLASRPPLMRVGGQRGRSYTALDPETGRYVRPEE